MLKIRNIPRIVPITLTLLTLLALITTSTPTIYADQEIAYQTTNAYDYPVKPGTDEWASFTSHTEMLDACQIPESVIENMSTSALVETVLNYPLASDMIFHNDIQAGFEAVSTHFNGIQELMSREDAATELISAYKSLDLSAVSEDWTVLQRVHFVWEKVILLEMLLAQPDIIDKMSETQYVDLLLQIRENSAIKQQKQEFYGGPSLSISSLVIERVTERHFSARCTSSYVYTPQSTQVSAYYWVSGCPEWANPSEVDAAALEDYPAAWWYATSTLKYNCHSYAWYQQSTSNRYWIAYPTGYMTDGSYSFKGDWPTGWSVGRKVFYNTPGDYHSGVAAWYWDGANIIGVTSKWGSGPLMNHPYNYCPYSYSNVDIYG